ncbi:MAG: Gfo/Idh/MocA family oxidoreductase [Acidobacteria bacterium]|nr:Gfo/Idh/MocA family oxidoreductase [Acidobacteriota bacterium]
MAPLRFAIVGCGDIGRLRAAALVALGRDRLGAVSDQDEARAASVAAAFGVPAEHDWRRLIERPDVDAVVVSTPPPSHEEIATVALDAGKHVLCEKPLGRTPHECHRMVAVAAASGRQLATGFNYRFLPSVKKARELFESGRIGDLDHIRSYSGYSASDHGHAWIHDVAVMGGGALRDNGIHLIDLTRWFLGEAVEVQAWGSNTVWRFPGCEDNGFALMRNASGRVASLHASWTEWRGYRFVIEIYGTRGWLRLSCFPMTTRVGWRVERGGRMRTASHLFPWTHLMEHARSYRWVVTRSFVEELRAFERAVAGEQTSIGTGHDGLRAVEIAAAAGSPTGTPADAAARRATGPTG